MPYAVRTEVFEGPFDLLLHLILQEEVDLYEISLSGIVDAYLAEVTRMDSLDLDMATEFVLIASILIELKTRRLLPDEEGMDLDEEFGLWEQRDLLLARLVECKTFKDASKVLQALLANAARSFPRAVGPEEHFLELAPDLLEGVTASDLARAYMVATTPRPEPQLRIDHVTTAKLSVTEAIVEVVDELARVGQITFRELTSALVDKVEIIVRFLAVLELYKQGLVELDQIRSFGEIHVQWIGQTDEPTAFDVELIDAYDG